MSKGPDWTAQVRNKRRIPPPLPVEPPSGSYVGCEVGWCGVSRETLLHFLYEEGLLICSIVCTPLILQQRGLLQRSRESTRKRRSSHHAICVHYTKATHDRGAKGGPGLPIFATTSISAFSINAQLRFASVVLDGVLGHSHLAHHN